MAKTGFELIWKLLVDIEKLWLMMFVIYSSQYCILYLFTCKSISQTSVTHSASFILLTYYFGAVGLTYIEIYLLERLFFKMFSSMVGWIFIKEACIRFFCN